MNQICNCVASADRAYDYGDTGCITHPWYHFPWYRTFWSKWFEHKKKAFEECDCTALGKYLHHVQDWYAHRRFGPGHPFSPSADDPKRNVPEYLATLLTTRQEFEAWWKKCLCSLGFE